MATDNKQNEVLLRYKHLIDISLEPIFSWDLESGILTWNKGCEKLYGFAREESLDQSSHELLQTRFPVSLEDLLQTLETKGWWSGELRHTTKSGAEVVVESHLQLVEFGGRRVVLEANRDITERKRAEATLRESQEHMSTVLESVSDAVYALDDDWRFTLFNRAAEDFFRRSRREVLGRRFLEVFPVAAGSIFEQSYRQVMQTRKMKTLEAQSVVNPDLYVELRVAPMGDGVVVSFSDVTARKQAEESAIRKSAHLQLLFDVAARLLTISNVEQFVDEVYRRLGSLIDLDGYLLYRAGDDEAGTLRLVAYDGIDQEVVAGIEELSLDQSVCGQAASSRAMIIAESVQQSYEPWTMITRSLGINACAAFPLMTPAGFYGTLSFARREQASFDPEEISLMRSVCDLIANGIERWRAEEKLRESEQRFRAVVDVVPDLLWSSNAQGSAEWYNRRWIEYTGLSLEESRDFAWLEAVHPDDRQTLLNNFQRALGTGGSFRHEMRIRSREGEYRWFLVQAEPVRDESGELIRWFGALTDIHEERVAMEALREREERLNLIVDGVHDYAIFTIDLENRITRWNTGAEKMFGWTESEAVGQSGEIIFTAEDRADQAPEKELRVAREHGHAGDERWHVRKDGSRFFVSGVTSPLRAGDRLIGYVKVARDLTERKRYEETVVQKSAHLQLLFDIAARLLVVDDIDQFVEEVYARLSKLIEVDCFLHYRTAADRSDVLNIAYFAGFERERAEQIRQIQYNDTVCGTVAARQEWMIIDDLQLATDAMTEFVQSLGLVAYASFPLLTSSGLYGTLSFGRRQRGNFVDDEVSLMHTVCDLIASAVDRKQAEEALKQADRRKNEFLATLAHELRNPLAPVRSGLEIIHRAECDEDMLWSTLKIIERQTDQIVRLVDDLLDISRITQGKITLRKDIIDLRAALVFAIETSRGQIEKYQHKLTVAVPDEPLYVSADFTRLSQVLLNLLNNAARYTPAGGSIRVSAAREGDDVVVRVEDNGIGIAPEMLPYIFEMFGQAVSHDEKPQSGLGIGLSLAQKLVELHGGTIQGYSEGEDKGSEFVVRLPAREAPEKTPRPARPSEKPAERTASRRILIVDDNVDAVKMLDTLLSLEGHQTRTALDGASALKAADEFRPEIVLLDIGLPQMSGHEVALRLREKMPGLLLIAISGWGQDEDRQRSKEAGFDYHLVKPVEFDELSKLLKEKHGGT